MDYGRGCDSQDLGNQVELTRDLFNPRSGGPTVDSSIPFDTRCISHLPAIEALGPRSVKQKRSQP